MTERSARFLPLLWGAAAAALLFWSADARTAASELIFTAAAVIDQCGHGSCP